MSKKKMSLQAFRDFMKSKGVTIADDDVQGEYQAFCKSAYDEDEDEGGEDLSKSQQTWDQILSEIETAETSLNAQSMPNLETLQKSLADSDGANQLLTQGIDAISRDVRARMASVESQNKQILSVLRGTVALQKSQAAAHKAELEALNKSLDGVNPPAFVDGVQSPADQAQDSGAGGGSDADANARALLSNLDVRVREALTKSQADGSFTPQRRQQILGVVRMAKSDNVSATTLLEQARAAGISI